MAGLLTPSVSDDSMVDRELYTSSSEGAGTPRFEHHVDSPLSNSSDVRPSDDADEGCGTRRRWTWRLVWCQERSHKPETEPLRAGLSSMAAQHGGMLLCYKKANKLEAWVQHAPRPPYVLLTDGREVKPCVQALCSLDQNRPRLIAVLAEQARHAARIRQWASQLPSQGVHVPVVIIGAIAELSGLLAGSLEMSSETTSTRPPLQTTGSCSTLGWTQAAPPRLVVLPRHAVVTSGRVMMAATSPVASPQPCVYADATRTLAKPMFAAGGQLATMGGISPLLGTKPPSCSSGSGPFFLERATDGVTAEVLQVLAPALPSSVDTNTLRIMLESAAPAVYDD